MTVDASGFGLRVILVASKIYPQSITLTQFADDADPIDLPSIKQMNATMGLNGDLVVSSAAVPITATMAMIPGSEDDVKLTILAEANRVGRGKNSTRDNITMTVSYPNGSTVTYTQGRLTDAPPGDSVASAGRIKSKVYGFVFENKIITRV